MQAIHSSIQSSRTAKQNIERRFTNSIFLLLLYNFPHFANKLKISPILQF